MSARSGGTAVEQRNHGGAGPLLQLRARGGAVLGLGVGGCGMGGERRGKAGVFKGGEPGISACASGVILARLAGGRCCTAGRCGEDDSGEWGRAVSDRALTGSSTRSSSVLGVLYVHTIVVTRRIALALFCLLFLCIVVLFLSFCFCLHVCAGLCFGVAIVSRR